jgi:hypothetical protein
MKLRRLLWADMTDVASRGWQELWRSFDRAAVASLPASGRVPPLFWHLRPQPVDAGAEQGRDAALAGLAAFRRSAVERFFAGAGDPRLPALLDAGLPEHRSHTLAAADALRERSFSLLGHRALFLDEPIDWHRDAVSGRKAPFVHWSRIDPLDQEHVGDSKVTWELNRHQWLVTLGQAYRMSGDESYASVFASSVRDWMEANPPGMGINWASSLEVSYRMISWCWALNLFRDSALLTPRLYADMLGWLCSHAAHVERYLSRYFSPNTHLTGEALGLFYAGVLFPELPRARRWQTLGARILQRELPRQVLPDGVYFEQSTCYGRYTAEIYLHFLILARRNGMAVPASVAERVQLLLDHLLAVSRPDGGLPQIGDADGGKLLPLGRRTADDCRDVFAVAAAFFKRADYAWAARGPAAETAWLLGPGGYDAFDALKPEPPPAPPSRLFPAGGCVVMQGGWGRDAHQLLFDAGPLGCRISGGHGHADLLSVQCSAFGRPQLVDPGTYCYTAHPNWRDHFRGSAAHSTVVIDRKSQAVTAGAFSWRKRPLARLRRWLSTPAFDYADADHDAYRRLPDPVRHRRRVLFVKPRYWVVVDDLLGADVHQVDLQLQFRPGQLVDTADGWKHAPGPEGRGLFIKAFAASPLQVEIHEGDVEPIRGWVSPDYGLRVPAPLLCYTTVVRLPLQVATLLVPRGGNEPPPHASVSYAAGGMSLVLEGWNETVSIDDRQISVAGAGRTQIEPLAPD